MAGGDEGREIDDPTDQPRHPPQHPWDLSSDEIVGQIQRGSRGPQDLTVLCGFLGKSDAPGHHRLFTDPTFKRWIDVPDDAIRYRHRVASEHDTHGGRSVLWVVNGALLLHGEVTVAGAEACFLSGPYSAKPAPAPDHEAIVFATLRCLVAAVSPAATPAIGCCKY
jgi:hypothetical protein